MERKSNKQPKLHIRKNDTVQVISGNNKGKTGKVLEVLIEKKRAIIEGAEWIVPEGVSIYEPDLKIVQTKLHWGEYRGGRQYTKSVEGYRLTTSCRVKIGENAQPGEHTLLLRFPALEQLGVFPSLIHSENRSDTKGAVKVKSFTVRGP